MQNMTFKLVLVFNKHHRRFYRSIGQFFLDKVNNQVAHGITHNEKEKHRHLISFFYEPNGGDESKNCNQIMKPDG